MMVQALRTFTPFRIGEDRPFKQVVNLIERLLCIEELPRKKDDQKEVQGMYRVRHLTNSREVAEGTMAAIKETVEGGAGGRGRPPRSFASVPRR